MKKPAKASRAGATQLEVERCAVRLRTHARGRSLRVQARPPTRDRSGPVVPTALPVSATALARSIAGADVPMPNGLSARHLPRIAGGLLYAATSSVPWATLLA